MYVMIMYWICSCSLESLYLRDVIIYLIMLCLSNRKKPLESTVSCPSTSCSRRAWKIFRTGCLIPVTCCKPTVLPPQTRTCWTAGWSNSRWTTPLRVYVTINNLIYFQNDNWMPHESNIKCSEVMQQQFSILHTAVLKCLLLKIAYCFTYYF